MRSVQLAGIIVAHHLTRLRSLQRHWLSHIMTSMILLEQHFMTTFPDVHSCSLAGSKLMVLCLRICFVSSAVN